VKVLLICFGTPEEARVWLEEVCHAFPLLLDPGRTVYRAYKLKSSLLHSWNPKTLIYYTRALLTGRKWRGIQGDSTQLGGDFIVNPDGRFLLSYPSRNATDRPKVSELLNILRRGGKE